MSDSKTSPEVVEVSYESVIIDHSRIPTENIQMRTQATTNAINQSNNISNSNNNADNVHSSPQTQTSESQQNSKYFQPTQNIAGLLQKILSSIRNNQMKSLKQNLHELVSDSNQFYLPKYSQKIGQVGIAIAQLYNKNRDNVHLLRYLGYIMLPNKDTRATYHKIIMHVTETMLKITIQHYSNKNTNGLMIDQEHNQTQMKQQQQPTQSQLNVKIVKNWQLYIELLKSYNYECLKLGLNQQNWLTFSVIFSLMLQDPQIDVKSNFTHLHTPIPQLLQTLISKCPAFFQQITSRSPLLFHKFTLFCRIFVSCTEPFLSTNNLVITPNQSYPITNNCTLLMNFVFKQFQKISESQMGSKLDCLMLLMTIVQGKMKKCQNYNKVLQFITTIITYVIECEQKNENQVTFYLGQLVAMVFYRNCQWVVQHCRKQKNKTLQKLLKIYEKSVKKAAKHADNLEHEHVVYKRLVFGMCGMLYLTKMDSVLQNHIKQINPYVIRIVQAQHGWKQPQQQSQHRQPQPKMMPSKLDPVWDEQYYSCNNLQQFQHLEQVEQLVKAVYAIKNNNEEVFTSIMDNFDEKQSIMWIAELENYGERVGNWDQEDWDEERDNRWEDQGMKIVMKQ